MSKKYKKCVICIIVTQVSLANLHNIRCTFMETDAKMEFLKGLMQSNNDIWVTETDVFNILKLK